MPRLIDADVMREDWLENGQNEYVYDTNAVLDSIDEQPTIEAEPVRHGKWEEGAFENSKRCSVCQKYATKVHCHSEPIFDYERCPYCGAKLDLRKD